MRLRVALASVALVGTLLAGALPATVLGADPAATMTSLILIGIGTTIEQHTPVTAQMPVGAPGDGWETDATLTLTEAGVVTPLCVVPAVVDNSTSCLVPGLGVGVHVLTATYSGNTLFASSGSDPYTLEVIPDVVHSASVTVQYSTFYPYKDGYRDTLAITGNRHEPIAVTIRIYNSAGTRVKLVSIARAGGAYKYTWNGRNSAGTMLAAGKYKVVQRLVDAGGTTKDVTRYVNLSAKRLHWSTTYVTKLGSSYSSRGTAGTGSVTRNTAAGSVRIKAPGSYFANWASVGYQFTLPSAVAYKGLYFQVYFSGALWAAPNDIKLQNFSTCPLTSGAWDEACFDHDGGLGAESATTRQWTSAHGSPTASRSGRTVRGMASIVAGTFYIYKARVKVTYAVLR